MQERVHCYQKLTAAELSHDGWDRMQGTHQGISRCTAMLLRLRWLIDWRLVRQVRCELMSGLTEFLRRRCRQLEHSELSVAAVWLSCVDHQLTGRQFQPFPFLGASSLVFVYMLARQAVHSHLANVDHLLAKLSTMTSPTSTTCVPRCLPASTSPTPTSALKSAIP